MSPRVSMPVRQIAGHVAMSGSSAAAWYRLAPVSWSFRPDRDREAYLLGQAAVLAQLAGRHIHLRGTTTPFPVRSWAEAHHSMVVAAGRPYGVEPLPGWPDLLEGEQRSFLGEHLSEKDTYIGVEFTRRSAAAAAAAVLAPTRTGTLSRELNHHRAALSALDTLMARPGMAASPVTGPQMAWLLHRSAMLGFPAPARRRTVEVDSWDSGDLADLMTETSWTAQPFATAVKITAVLDGRPVTRYAAVLTVGRMQPMDIPRADQPWMCVPDNLGIPLEWSAHVYPRANKEVLAEIRKTLGAISSQTRHYEIEHGMDAPSALAEQREEALAVERELTALSDPSLSRARGWWRVAVGGATAEECLDAAERVVAAYGRTIEIEHTFGQYSLAREFLRRAQRHRQPRHRRFYRDKQSGEGHILGDSMTDPRRATIPRTQAFDARRFTGHSGGSVPAASPGAGTPSDTPGPTPTIRAASTSPGPAPATAEPAAGAAQPPPPHARPPAAGPARPKRTAPPRGPAPG